MRLFVKTFSLMFLLFLSIFGTASASGDIAVYRLYNEYNKEHLYTTDLNEVNTLASQTWTKEGTGWYSPEKGTPVFRLYSPITRAHLYTTDVNEVNTLSDRGWSVDNDRKALFYSANSGVPVYRLYHEGIRMHLLTTDKNEYEVLAQRGWRQEGVAFYANSLSNEQPSTGSNNSNSSNILEEFVDSNNSGYPDCIEKNDTKTDTDNDGLSDYDELTKTGTSPLRADTDGDGISDKDSDEDLDGLSNYEELKLNSNPLSKDTDNDGLDDYQETVYGTNINNADTDNDGASDGWEIENGYDPLVYNSSFNITGTIEDGGLQAQVTTTSDGVNASSFNIESVESSPLYNEETPGYLGKAIDITTEKPITQATISFDIKGLPSSSDLNPAIYYIDEDNQTLEELPTTINGTVASTVVTHFSKYALINKTQLDQIWEEDIRKPNEVNTNNGHVSIVFVLDRSQSMDDNDPKNLRNSLTKGFIEKLDGIQDLGSLISFIQVSEPLTGLTNDKYVLNRAVDSIVNDDGWGSQSGTNGSAGLFSALNELENDSSGNTRYVVLMTDGEDTHTSYNYNDLIDRANAGKIHIMTIGLGKANTNLLKNLANQTNGSYYYANDSEQLDEAFLNVEESTIDYHQDSNNDGISDYYTRLLTEGKLRTSTGLPVFEGVSYDEIQKNADYDHDGIKNGDEVKVIEKNNKVSLKVYSSPELADTDGDGIPDAKDTAPLKKGLAGGVVGELSIVSNHTDGKNFTQGHSWIEFNSYIKDTLSLSNFSAAAIYDSSTKKLSFQHSKVNYPLNCSGTISIGNFSTHGNYLFPSSYEGSTGGILINQEYYSLQNGNNTWSDTVSYKKKDLTLSQLEDIINYCSENNYYNLYSHNCSTVASDIWRIAFGSSDNFSAKTGSDLFYTPMRLKETILKKSSGVNKNHSATMLSNLNSWK